MNTLEYKCPYCAGAVSFDSASQQMKCPYCESVFDLTALTEYKAEQSVEQADSWNTYQGEAWLNTELSTLNAYSCPSCGGEIISETTTAATHCPYCGNPSVLLTQLSGLFKPDYVIPFKLDKQAAKSGLINHLKRKPLLPKLFRAENRIDNISGIYVPFWLFDCSTHARINYKATRVSHWSDSRYNYTKTDYFHVLREGDVDFERVPADGSVKMDDTLMDSIEPFEYSELKPFQAAYLSGFLADKYDVDSEACRPRIYERIKNSTEKLFRDTAHGYTTCVTEKASLKVTEGLVNYALLPVWMLNTKYQDKMYSFVMNGQTGKFVGNLPTDIKLFCFWLLGLFAAFSAIGSLALFIIRATQTSYQIDPFNTKNILIVLGVSALLALVADLIMKSRMKSVRPQKAAEEYVNDFRLTTKRDSFLYSHVDKSVRQQNASSSVRRK